MSGRIDLTELRAVVEADGYPNAQDVLALVEAVEAAREYFNLTGLTGEPTEAHGRMNVALARFSFEDSR